MTVYLDNASTTQVGDAAKRAFMRVCESEWGNPSALHEFGVRAAVELDGAAKKIACAMNASGGEIVFTAGGTEANNLAVIGACERHRGGRVIISSAEHASVEAPAKFLSGKGFDVIFVSGKGDDPAFLNRFEKAIDDSVIFASVMTENNENGRVFPVNKAAAMLKARCPGAVFHTDAVQAFCKMSLDLTGIDLCSVSGHKIGAPQGIGALWIADGVKLAPRFYGGHGRNQLRPGTEPVALAAAMGAAAEHMMETLPERTRIAERFCADLRTACEGLPVVFNGGDSPFIVSISLPRLPSEVLMRFLQSEGVIVSAGAACSGGKASTAGIDLIGENVKYTIRVSLGEQNTPEEAQVLAAGLKAAAGRFPSQIGNGSRK